MEVEQAATLPPPPQAGSGGLQRQLTGLGDALGDRGRSVATPNTSFAALSPGASVAPSVGPFEIRLAGTTDPGVQGKQNQDDYFIWESEDRSTIIVAVLDGHGREMGQVAAKVAKGALRDALSRPDALARIRTEPRAVLDAAFRTAHITIEKSFQSHYEDAGWTVERSADGYLTRSRRGGPSSMCIHGGTTATVLLLLDGRRAVIANVGDSTAIISGLGHAGTLRPVSEWEPMPPRRGAGGAACRCAAAAAAAGAPPAAACACAGGAGGGSAVTASATPLSRLPLVPVPAAVASSYMELSADHSPECAAEFARVAAFRPHGAAAHHPELLFVYDTLTASKLSCPSIFEVDGRSGAAARTERGSYYKNVRCEWATLVATPPHAPFQDALAFTRSLGDLHLQTYGVSHTPEVWWLDLTAPPGEAPLVPHALGLVVASDGIWDNWKFEEVAAVTLSPGTLAEVVRSDSAQGAVDALMAANLERARVNFGSSADNMTAICVYLFPRPAATTG